MVDVRQPIHVRGTGVVASSAHGASGGASRESLVSLPYSVNRTVLFVSISIAVAYGLLQHGHGFAFGALLAVLIALVGITYSMRAQVTRSALLVGLSTAFFALMLFVRANTLLVVLNAAALTLLFNFYIHLLASGKSLRAYRLSEYVFMPLSLSRFIAQANAFQYRHTAVGESAARTALRERLFAVLVGVLVSAPLVLILLLILISADGIFAAYVSAVWHSVWEFIKTWFSFSFIVRVFVSVCVMALVTGILSYIYRRESTIPFTREAERTPTGSYLHRQIHASTFLSMVNAVFISYILVYILFKSGFYVDTLPADVTTYAEYARRGFFELLAAAALAFAALLGVDAYKNQAAQRSSAYFKVVSVVLVAQVLFLLVLSFTKLSLYEVAYGFTTLRLWSHAFTILLGTLFVGLVVKVVTNKGEHIYGLALFVSMSFFLAGMNLLNPDAFIMQHNLARYETTGDVDTQYLMSLSSDAYGVLVAQAGQDGSIVPQILFNEYLPRAAALRSADWRSLHLSEMQVIHSPLMQVDTE